VKGSPPGAAPPKPPAGKSSELHFLDVDPAEQRPGRPPGLVRPGLGGGKGIVGEPRKSARPAAPRPAPARRGTVERIAEAVGAQTLVLRRALAAGGVLLVAGVAAAYLLGRSESRVNAEQLERLLKRNDSLSAAYEEDMDRLVGRVEGLDSALAISKRESDALRASLRRAPDAAVPSAREVQELSVRVRSAEARHTALITASRTDYQSIAVMNGPAIALIAVERADGSSFTGSGFGATADGLVVTNRHLVRDESGRPPRRVAVIFADTRAWLPARVVRVGEGDDLALLRIERRGQYPAVRAVTAARPPAVGAPIAIMGYPLGIETPMEGAGTQITARATLGVGTVSKILDDVVQIDAYAGEGSSGSPVFDAVGAVVGVVYGGARESGGRIVYAVPGERLTALLALEGR
jgi:S1-C subfamily serine protease